MIERAKRIMKHAATAVFGQADIQKKAGLHIYRNVGNAQKWSAWLVASGVPNPKGADELRVTVMTVLGDVQVIPAQHDYVIHSTSGVFCRIGGKLCFAWYDYAYYDRHWSIREIAGCEVCYHSRAVMVLSDDPGEFEFSDDALMSAPVTLVLEGESTEAMVDDAIEITKSAATDLFTPSAATAEKAKKALRESFDNADADPMQQAALDELTRGKPVVKSQIIGDLGDDLAHGLEIEGAPEPKQHREPIDGAGPIVPGEIDSRKTAEVETAKTVDVVKKDTSRRTIYGWASVATVDGELYEDLHGDTISPEALHDICELVVMEGQNAGGVEHEETPNAIAAAIVIDDGFAAAMSDNFFFDDEGVLKTKKQGLFIGYHYRDEGDWELAKDSPVEFSINGTAFVADPEEK